MNAAPADRKKDVGRTPFPAAHARLALFHTKAYLVDTRKEHLEQPWGCVGWRAGSLMESVAWMGLGVGRDGVLVAASRRLAGSRGCLPTLIITPNPHLLHHAFHRAPPFCSRSWLLRASHISSACSTPTSMESKRSCERGVLGGVFGGFRLNHLQQHSKHWTLLLFAGTP